MQQRDTLTSLGARNSLLLDRGKMDPLPENIFSIGKTGSFPSDTKSSRDSSPERLYSANDVEKGSLQSLYVPSAPPSYRPITPATPINGDQTRENLLASRQPTLPSVGDYGGGYGGGYGRPAPGHYFPPPGNYPQDGYGNPPAYGRSPPRGGY